MLELKDNNGKLLSKKVQKRVNDFIDHLKEISRFKPSKDLQKSEVEKQVKFTLKCFGIEAEIEYRKLSTHKDWDSACYSALDSAWASARASAWDSAWASARDSALDSARDSACDSARASAWASARASALDSALDSARDSACDSACDSARASAWASARASALDSALDSARDSACDSACDSAWASARASACYSALDSAWDSALASARASAWASAEILLKDNKQFKEKYPKGAFIQLMKIFEMWLYPVGILEENKKFVIYVPSIPSRVPKDFN